MNKVTILEHLQNELINEFGGILSNKEIIKTLFKQLPMNERLKYSVEQVTEMNNADVSDIVQNWIELFNNELERVG